MFLRIAAGCLLTTFAGFPLSSALASDITGERIFDGANPRVEKVDKVLEAAQAAADAELKAAQVRHLRTGVKILERAVESLRTEEASAKQAGDSVAVAALVVRRKAVQAKLETARIKFEEETGESASVAASVAAPSADPVAPPTVARPSPVAPPLPVEEVSLPVAHPVSEAAPTQAPSAPVPVILPGDVPILMLGRWKVLQGGRDAGVFELSSTGQNKVYAAFKPNGAKALHGGIWRVASDGEVTLVGDGGAAEMFRLALVAPGKAAGFSWTRKSEGVPYRKGDPVELIKGGK